MTQVSTTADPRDLYLWMRFDSAARALASARRLDAKYGPGFAVVSDPAMPGDTMPYAVVSTSAAPRRCWNR
jgi:hypothetical protein